MYNFFKDSAANASEWQLVLSGDNSDVTHNPPAPDFDEIRHASIYTEVLLSIPPRATATKLRHTVEVLIRCHHMRREKSLVFGRLRKRRAYEGTRLINLLPDALTVVPRPIGGAEIKSKSGVLLVRFLGWPQSPPHRIGPTLGNCLLSSPVPEEMLTPKL